MSASPPAHSAVFRMLCRVLGGQDRSALQDCIAAQQLPRVFAMAQVEDLLPALAVRCGEQPDVVESLGEQNSALLAQALKDNTLRNMAISAQALKLARALNRADIAPLFLKGTARLLTVADETLGMRKQADIDLLVRPEELEAASDALLADGYRFSLTSEYSSSVAGEQLDSESAIRLSAAHHHLPPLVKTGYTTTVELHRHFLPRRFQRGNPLAPLFGTANQCERLGATFLVPATEYQLIHLILGKLVNDGHFARRSFPIREACDLVDLLDSAGHHLDQSLLLHHCGTQFTLFHTLVAELLAYRSPIDICSGWRTANYIRTMQKRYDSKLVRTLLDTNARLSYLSHELVYSPGKLPDYLRRVLSANQPRGDA